MKLSLIFCLLFVLYVQKIPAANCFLVAADVVKQVYEDCRTWPRTSILCRLFACTGLFRPFGSYIICAYLVELFFVHMRRLEKTHSPIFILLCDHCFQRQPFIFLFYFTGFKCHLAAINRVPVRLHNVDYIFVSHYEKMPIQIY